MEEARDPFPYLLPELQILPTSYPASVTDDACSCFVILLTFWLFTASLTLILGFFGSVDLVLGPNTSYLLRPNSFFVQGINLEAVSESTGEAVTLYGLSKQPPLDLRINWTEATNFSIPPNVHKEWAYYLNEGARIDISYQIETQASYSDPLILVIAQGKDNLQQWAGNPYFPGTTLSWNLINGNGEIQQKISTRSDYYVALSNIGQIEMEAHLTFRIKALLYNTTGAYYKCSLNQSSCNLNISLLRSSSAIIATSGPQMALKSDEWNVKLSYGPRWGAYFAGSVIISILIMIASQIFIHARLHSSGNTTVNNGDGVVVPERTPLLTTKDDDNLSLGSSYDSVSHDGESDECAGNTHLEESAAEDKNLKCLCAVCMDAPVDCFFLPCGHCTTCCTCGMRLCHFLLFQDLKLLVYPILDQYHCRIVENAGVCPLCTRKTKKVKKIISV